MNNMQGNNARDLDVMIPMYSLLEYSDNYSTQMDLYRFK